MQALDLGSTSISLKSVLTYALPQDQGVRPIDKPGQSWETIMATETYAKMTKRMGPKMGSKLELAENPR